MLTVNIEDAKIETQAIGLNEIWKPAHKKTIPSSSKKYKLLVSLIEGRINNKESVKVVIRKKISYQKNFFSEERKLLSDGVEEEILLYRIERELINFAKIQKIK